MKALIAVTALALSLSAAFAQQPQHTLVNVNDIAWKEAPPALPGAQISVLYGDPTKDGVFVMRLKFPANYKIPAHTHPVDEIVTVISGEFNLGMGKEFKDADLKAYKVGALIAMEPGMQHFGLTREETVIQISTKGPWALNFVNANDKGQMVR